MPMIETLFSAVAVAAIVSVIILYVYVKKEAGKDWVYAVCFITILSCGIVLYSMGLSYGNDKDTSFSPLFILAKAVDSAVRSFGGVFNAGAVTALAKENSVYSVAIFVHYIFSVIMTALVAVKLFGRNAVNRIRVYFISNRSKYIVAGAGAEAEIFLNSLDRAKARRTIVVLPAKDKNKKKEMLVKGFPAVTVKDKRDRDLEHHVRTALTTAGIARGETVAVAMADDDEFNLLIAKIAAEHVRDIVKPVKDGSGRIVLTKEQDALLTSVRLTAYVMYTSLERAEHFSFTEYALGKVRFFNTSEIRAHKFILENPITSIVPRQWIDTGKARLRSGDGGICHIFVGFGDTNRHILRKSICDHQVLGADYNALVIDKNAKELEGRFRNSAPGLFDRTENGIKMFGAELLPDREYFEQPKERCNIVFETADALSEGFFRRIVSEAACRDLVSVVIALGDDKISIGTALELRQKLYERGSLKKDGYDRVRIFVRVFRDSVLSDRGLLNDKGIDHDITIFGAASETLTERYIIQEDLDITAKCIANDYWRGAGEIPRSGAVTKWDLLSEFKRQSNRYAAMALRTKLNLLGFELCAGEGTDDDTVNAYNTAYGMDAAERQRRYADENGIFVEYLERDENGIIDNARNNLARLEHQRWAAMHLAGGWTKLPKNEVTAASRQNERTRQHACITTMDGLAELRDMQAAAAVRDGEDADKAMRSADSVNFDFDVMDNLFKILKDTKFIVKRR